MSRDRSPLRLIPLVLAVALFTLAVVSLRESLATYRWGDFAAYLRSLPVSRAVLAVAMTLLGYGVMTGYDAFALRYIERSLRYWRVALASFTGYAINNNVGLSGVIGMSLRYRFYSGWGLGAGEIARVFVFCTVTYWLGFAILGGLVFLVRPPVAPEALAIPLSSLRALGAVLLVPALLYLFPIVVRCEALRFRKLHIVLPKPSLFVIQVVVSIADWVLAGAVLYVLLPPIAQPFFDVLAIFLLAQIAGLVSNVPGGLGVFEAVALLFLKPSLDPPTILGALIAFRGIYFLFPLAIALLLLAGHETSVRVRLHKAPSSG